MSLSAANVFVQVIPVILLALLVSETGVMVHPSLRGRQRATPALVLTVVFGSLAIAELVLLWVIAHDGVSAPVWASYTAYFASVSGFVLLVIPPLMAAWGYTPSPPGVDGGQAGSNPRG